MNPEDLDAMLNEWPLPRALPGETLFIKVWGSYSHNTNLPTSDVDYLAVYEADPLKLLSLNPPPETVDGSKPDFQAHELGKFASLLRKGNPGVIECLFTEHGIRGYSPAWDELRAIRQITLNQQTLKQYLGYCTGQLQRMKNALRLHTAGGQFNTKWAYHLIRLANDALRISGGLAPVVFKPDGSPERDQLMQIRGGLYSPAAVEDVFNEIDAAIQLHKKELPAALDERLLDHWLVTARRRTFDHISAQMAADLQVLPAAKT